jgi:hypothetical protein
MSDRIIVREDSIERIVPCTNHLLVKVDVVNCQKNGLYVASEEWDADGSTVTRFGTVVSIPSEFFHRKNGREFGMEWDTELEAQIGDVAYWGLMEGTDCAKILCKEDVYYLIDYSEVRVIVRGEEVIPVNGFVIVEEFVDGIKSDFLITPETAKKANHKKGIVKYVGKRNASYYNGDESTCDPKTLNVGDTVLLQISAWTKLEDNRFSSLEKSLGYTQGRWIVAILN